MPFAARLEFLSGTAAAAAIGIKRREFAANSADASW